MLYSSPNISLFHWINCLLCVSTACLMSNGAHCVFVLWQVGHLWKWTLIPCRIEGLMCSRLSLFPSILSLPETLKVCFCWQFSCSPHNPYPSITAHKELWGWLSLSVYEIGTILPFNKISPDDGVKPALMWKCTNIHERDLQSFNAKKTTLSRVLNICLSE